MANAWDRYLQAASGLTEVTRKKAEQVVRTLVRQGEIAAERAEKTIDELLKRSEQNRKAIGSLVRAETERTVARLGLARQRDVERLERRLAEVEKKAGGAAKAASKAAKKTSKKAAARKKAAGKKTAAKKTAAKKTGGTGGQAS